jgi:hypothetical protein
MCSCGVRVKYSYNGWGWPGTYKATDGVTEITYWDCQIDNCCHLKREVLEILAEKSNSGEFPWSKMQDSEFRREQLSKQCAELSNVKVIKH